MDCQPDLTDRVEVAPNLLCWIVRTRYCNGDLIDFHFVLQIRGPWSVLPRAEDANTEGFAVFDGGIASAPEIVRSALNGQRGQLMSLQRAVGVLR